MRLVNACTFAFARRGKNSESKHSYEQIAKAKGERMKYYQKKYDFYELFQHEDKYFEEYIYGHTCYIAGLTSSNYQSQVYTKSMMKFAQPNLLLLGGISDNYLRLYENFLKIRQFYQHPLYKAEKMGCKERIGRMIQERLEKDSDFLWDDFQKEIRIINTEDKRIQPHDYLTAAHLASSELDTKVALGKPSDTVVFEDLIMRYSVQELKDIAQRAISKVMQSRPKEKTWRLSFTREIVQNYVMSDIPELFSKEVTYQAALLKRYAKLQDKILMLVPGHFAGRIAAQVHQIDVKPQNVYRVGLEDKNSESYAQFEKIMRSDPQQILQKFCLLTLLKQSWLELEFANGTNIFRYFCFGKLFEGMGMDQLAERYMRAKRSVESKWYELMQQRVKNLHLEQGPHFRMKLGEQFKVLDERVTKNFPYAYEQKNYLSIHEDGQKLMKLENRMREMLNEQGDKFKIELFEEFKQGRRSKEGIILYAKLLGKANIQSYDRLKLPVFHYGAFRGIYKEYLRDFMLKAEQNSKFQQKLKKKEKNIEEMIEKFMKKLDDPEQLHKAITGKMGKVINLSFDPNQGPVVSPDQLEEMKQFYGQMTPQKQREIQDQFGQDWFKIEKDEETK